MNASSSEIDYRKVSCITTWWIDELKSAGYKVFSYEVDVFQNPEDGEYLKAIHLHTDIPDVATSVDLWMEILHLAVANPEVEMSMREYTLHHELAGYY